MNAMKIDGKELVRALQKAGFAICRQRGSHVHLEKKCQDKAYHVTVPIHGNDELNPFVLHSIARQAGYTYSDFVRLISER